MKTALDVKNALDMDLMVNLVNNDPGHIARAKSKAERVRRERVQEEQRQGELGRFLSGSAAGIGVWSLLMAALV